MPSERPIYRLETCLAEDYPAINWSRHREQSQAWLELDERCRTGAAVEEISADIAYTCRLGRRWKRIDCISLAPTPGVSSAAKEVLEKLGVPGLRFLPFQVNGEPFHLVYTERCVDCL